MILDRGKSDWLNTPGEWATLTIGPVEFYVDTADGLGFGVAVRIGHFHFSYGGGRD